MAHIISYHFISFHIISYQIISYHIISFHIISYHFISYHIISYHIISYHIISYHFISYHIISYHYIPPKKMEHNHIGGPLRPLTFRIHLACSNRRCAIRSCRTSEGRPYLPYFFGFPGGIHGYPTNAGYLNGTSSHQMDEYDEI